MPLLSKGDFAQDPDAPLPASLQQLVDELIRGASSNRIIIASRRGGSSAAMAEIARQMAAKTDESALKGKSGGGVAVPCPWGREDGRETFYPADYLPMNDSSKKVADSVARKIRRQDEIDALRYALEAKAKQKESQEPSTDLKPRHVVDRLRIADILQAMTMRNATDKAIPEEWMDELSDLVWRERDRLGANTED
jgi:hypothetical protein